MEVTKDCGINVLAKSATIMHPDLGSLRNMCSSGKLLAKLGMQCLLEGFGSQEKKEKRVTISFSKIHQLDKVTYFLFGNR